MLDAVGFTATVERARFVMSSPCDSDWERRHAGENYEGAGHKRVWVQHDGMYGPAWYTPEPDEHEGCMNDPFGGFSGR
jgi:hypothetical protein